MKKSHIQLSKGHMKPFSTIVNGDYLSFLLDVNSKNISLENIKLIDTISGFYDDNIEDEMNKQYESKFFSLRNHLINVIERKTEIQVKFGKKEQNIILEFLNLAILRSKETIDLVNRESIAAIFLGGLSNNDLMNAKFTGILSERIFTEYSALIIKNNTAIDFVLPANSYYYSKKIHKEFTETEFNLFIPISPKLSLLLLLNCDYNTYIKNHGFAYLVMNNSRDIEYLNERAYRSEVHFNKKFIISKSRKELEALLLVKIE